MEQTTKKGRKHKRKSCKKVRIRAATAKARQRTEKQDRLERHGLKTAQSKQSAHFSKESGGEGEVGRQGGFGFILGWVFCCSFKKCKPV